MNSVFSFSIVLKFKAKKKRFNYISKWCLMDFV